MGEKEINPLKIIKTPEVIKAEQRAEEEAQVFPVNAIMEKIEKLQKEVREMEIGEHFSKDKKTFSTFPPPQRTSFWI